MYKSCTNFEKSRLFENTEFLKKQGIFENVDFLKNKEFL